MKFSLTGEYTIQKVLRKKNDRTMAREKK